MSDVRIIDITNGMLVVPDDRRWWNEGSVLPFDKMAYAATIEDLPKAVASVKALMALDKESNRSSVQTGGVQQEMPFPGPYYAITTGTSASTGTISMSSYNDVTKRVTIWDKLLGKA